MRRSAFLLTALSIFALFLAGSSLAADAPVKDPVELAFALPRGLVLTAEEAKWANEVRAQLEPRLRDALQRVQESTDKKEKVAAAKEIAQIRSQIKAAINTIIQRRAVIAAQEYAKKVAEARKKAAAQKKKRAGKKKKGKRKKKR